MNKNSKPRQSWRFMNRDGTLNVERIGVRRAFYTDTYHSLLSLKWGKFMGYLVGYYFVVNCFFALAYMACGPQALEGSRTDSFAAHFVDAFFFSVQTFATIGYGKITPSGIAANLVVTFEALVGLLGLALATGLLFARFSKPTAKVVFSHSALMTKQDGIPCLIFRVANERLNQIVDAEMNVMLTISEKTAEGENYRNFYDLPLERGRSPLFALTWTIVHPLTPESPLYGKTREDLIASEALVMASLTGIDDTFSQTIHARYSFSPEDLIWDRYFADMLTREGDRIAVDLTKIHSLKES